MAGAPLFIFFTLLKFAGIRYTITPAPVRARTGKPAKKSTVEAALYLGAVFPVFVRFNMIGNLCVAHGWPCEPANSCATQSAA